jgi:hypothetical protein
MLTDPHDLLLFNQFYSLRFRAMRVLLKVFAGDRFKGVWVMQNQSMKTMIVALLMSGQAAFAGETDPALQKERLDQAGRERMLIQRIAKSTCFSMSGIEPERYAQVARKDIETFERVMLDLVGGSDDRGWQAETDLNVVRGIEGVLDTWAKLRPATLQVAHGDMLPVVFDQVMRLTDPTAAQVNAVVGEMLASGSDGQAMARQAKTVNAAGRQRMLTQKIAKQFCFLSNGVQTEQNRAGLKADMALFAETLDALHGAVPEGVGFVPASSDGAALLTSAQTLWGELEPVLQRGLAAEELTRDELRSVGRMSTQLLAVMVKVVKTYVAMEV